MPTSNGRAMPARTRLPDFEARSVALFASLARGGAPPAHLRTPASSSPTAACASGLVPSTTAPSHRRVGSQLHQKSPAPAITGL